MILRVILAAFILCAGFQLSADEKDIAELYALTNLSVPERSIEKHLADINSIANRAPENEHLVALASVLKAHYYLFQEDFIVAKDFLVKAKPSVDLIDSKKLSQEYNFANVFILRADGQISQAIAVSEELYKQVIESWPSQKLSHLVLEIAYVKSFEYQYDESLDLLQVAMDYAYDSQDPYQMAETYNLFGIIYSELNDDPSATMYFQKAVDTMERHPFLVKNTYLYANLADSYRMEKKYDKTNELLNKANAIALEANDVGAIAFNHQIRSRLLVDQEDYQGALENLLSAKEYADQIGESLFNYELHSELAFAYLKLNLLDDAQTHLDLADSFSAKQDDNDRFYFERLQANLFAKQNKHQEAYLALDNSYKQYRTHFNDNLTKVSNLAREQLDKERLSFDNRLLEKENQLSAKNAVESQRSTNLLWFFVASLLISIAILLWFMYRFRQLARDNQKLALTDNLTRMPNRRHIFRKLRKHHAVSEKGSGVYSIILFDLDHFKNINDRYGHHIGDKVIQSTKNICQLILRDSDAIGRIGGEEFLIILPDAGTDDAYKIAERIREQFEVFDFEALARDLKVTASFGVTQYLVGDSNLDFVINRADRLLYKAKNEGRNKVCATFG